MNRMIIFLYYIVLNANNRQAVSIINYNKPTDSVYLLMWRIIQHYYILFTLMHIQKSTCRLAHKKQLINSSADTLHAYIPVIETDHHDASSHT